MNRCDYCEYRNSWECDDGWGRVNNNNMCDNFKLDFSQLSEDKKRTIQSILMAESEDKE